MESLFRHEQNLSTGFGKQFPMLLPHGLMS